MVEQLSTQIYRHRLATININPVFSRPYAPSKARSAAGTYPANVGAQTLPI